MRAVAAIKSKLRAIHAQAASLLTEKQCSQAIELHGCLTYTSERLKT